MTLGTRFRQLRLKKKKTQEEVAIALDLERSAIGHMERGTWGISTDQLQAFARFLGMTPEGVMRGVNEPTAKAS